MDQLAGIALARPLVNRLDVGSMSKRSLQVVKGWS
jgi:hypothetical protein